MTRFSIQVGVIVVIAITVMGIWLPAGFAIGGSAGTTAPDSPSPPAREPPEGSDPGPHELPEKSYRPSRIVVSRELGATLNHFAFHPPVTRSEVLKDSPQHARQPTVQPPHPEIGAISIWGLISIIGTVASIVSVLLAIYLFFKARSTQKEAQVTAQETQKTAKATKQALEEARRAHDVERTVNINQLLDEARDLLGGQPGMTSIKEFETDSKRLAQAKRKISAALDLDPEHKDALLRLGTYHESQKRIQSALDLYTELIERYPGFADAYHNLGCAIQRDAIRRVPVDTERLRQAEVHHRKVIELVGYSAAAYHNLGGNLIFQGELDAAEQVLKEALEHDSTNVVSWANLGIVHFRLRRFEESTMDYRRAVELDTDYAPAYSGLGSALLELGDYLEASRAYGKAIVLDPTHIYAHHSRGRALQELRRFDEAIACFKNAAEIDPVDHENWCSLGYAFLSGNRLEDALDAFKQALALMPGCAKAFNGMGAAHVKEANIRQAVENFRQAIEIDSDFKLARENLLRYEPALEQLEHRAAFNYAELLRVSGEPYLANCRMGESYKKLGLLDEAAEVYEEAIRNNSESAEAHNGLGEILQLQGNWEEAAEHYAKAIALDKKFVPAYRNLAVLSNREGRLGESLRLYGEAMEVAPTKLQATLQLDIDLMLRSHAAVEDVAPNGQGMIPDGGGPV